MGKVSPRILLCIKYHFWLRKSLICRSLWTCKKYRWVIIVYLHHFYTFSWVVLLTCERTLGVRNGYMEFFCGWWLSVLSYCPLQGQSKKDCLKHKQNPWANIDLALLLFYSLMVDKYFGYSSGRIVSCAWSVLKYICDFYDNFRWAVQRWNLQNSKCWTEPSYSGDHS